MKALFITALVVLLGAASPPAHAQGPTVLSWQREYFGQNPFNAPGGLARLSRTRYAVGGTIAGRGGYNIPFVQFVNERGDTLSSRRYPVSTTTLLGDGVMQEVGGRSDGGFVAVAFARDSVRRYGTMLLVGDSTGRLRVRRFLDMSPNENPATAKLLMLPDDGFLLCLGHILANGRNSPRLYRFDAAGNLVWRRLYPTQDHEIVTLLLRLDGSYALVGIKARTVAGRYPQDVWIGGLTAWGDTLPARRYARLRGTDDPSFGVDAALLPDGGMVLAGLTRPLVAPAGTGSPRSDGYVVRFDSAGRVMAQQVVTSPVSARNSSNCELQAVRVLASGEVLALGPYLRLPTSRTDAYDLGVFTFDPATLAVRSQQFYQGAPFGSLYGFPLKAVYEPSGTLSVAGLRRRPQAPSGNLVDGIGLLRLAAPALYQPPYCRTPPVAYFAGAVGARADTLRVLEASTPGPRYGQLVLWRWDWGDGTTSSGPAPGPHAYGRVPAAGTAVTLTVTNNLGCTATVVQYPWGRPTATQASRALAAALQVFPNPAGATAQVRLAGLGPQPPVPAALLDALGRTVWQGALPVQAGTLAHTLDVSALAAGLYTLRLLPREGPLTRRLAVQP